MTTHTDLIARLRAYPTRDGVEAADALESLEQQVAALKYDLLVQTESCKQLGRIAAEKDDERIHFRDQVAALRVDAERYRWLREQGWIDDSIMESKRIIDGAVWTLDAAIDAAMGEK